VLPSYLRIVDLGRLALPFLEKKLSEDRNGDFMLAEAVMEICREAPESLYRRKAPAAHRDVGGSMGRQLL
jgi:hypothetical protein